MMICKLIQSNKHIPLHPLGGCNKYKKKKLLSPCLKKWQNTRRDCTKLVKVVLVFLSADPLISNYTIYLYSSLTVFLPAQKPRPLMQELVIHFQIVAWIQTMFLKSATWWCFCISQKKVFLRQFLKILTSQTNFTQVPYVTNSMCAASSVNSVFNIKTIGDNNIEYLNVLSRTI